MGNEIQSRRFPDSRKKVTIIGGGVGGLTLAAKLDRRKFAVTIYEKNGECGGRCWTGRRKGDQESEFHFEKGAILYLFDDVYKKIFSEIDESFDSEKWDDMFVTNKTFHQIFLADGTKFTYSGELSKMSNQIDAIEKGANTQEKVQRFCNECEGLEKFMINNVFYKTYDSRWEMIKAFFLNNFCTNIKILYKALRYSMYALVGRYFKSDLVCQALTFQSLYFGISPFTGSSLFSILVAYEIKKGLKYPLNGMRSIVKRLETLAKTNGAKIVKGKGVAKINIDGNKATGVKLDDGTFVRSDVVVSNADLTYTYNVLLKDESDAVTTSVQRAINRTAAELAKKDHTPSTITFLWGMKERIEGLRSHNIFLPRDYKKLFDDINVKKKIPDDPAFFIHIANRLDPNMGKEALTVIVPIGEMADEKWEQDAYAKEKVEMVKKKVIAKLEERLNINNFESLICEDSYQTPQSWKTEFNCWQGSILGISHTLDNLLYNRPRQRCEPLSNVYFVGASTQPGTGVPLVMCSARSLAPKIENDLIQGRFNGNSDDKKMK